MDERRRQCVLRSVTSASPSPEGDRPFIHAKADHQVFSVRTNVVSRRIPSACGLSWARGHSLARNQLVKVDVLCKPRGRYVVIRLFRSIENSRFDEAEPFVAFRKRVGAESSMILALNHCKNAGFDGYWESRPSGDDGGQIRIRGGPSRRLPRGFVRILRGWLCCGGRARFRAAYLLRGTT